MTCTKVSFAVGSAAFSLTAKVAAGITADKVVSLPVAVSSSTNDLDSADRTTTVDTNVDAPDPIVTPPPAVAGRPLASCISRRRFTVHLSRKAGPARGARVTKARLVNAKNRTLRTLRVSLTAVDVDMRSMAMGRVTLRITIKLRSGKTARVSHSYETCWPGAA
jgi:hypothetical protein